MKKILALVLALAMILMVSAAFAADGDLTVDTDVSVSGLETGDTVKAYQFITWSEADNDWKIAANVGLSMDDIKDGLTVTELATLASNVSHMTEVTDGTITSGTWKKTCGTVATAGSYLVLVTSGTNQYVYNPAVVSADFDDSSASAIRLTSSDAMIKKQEITLDKEIDNKPDDYDVQVGDIVPFTVSVTVPQFNANWTEPVFEVTDSLSAGLTLQTLPTIAGLVEGADKDYKLTGAVGGNTFTISFNESYLKNNASKKIEIKYSALVGEAVKDTVQVHEEENDVTLTFSNNPSDSSSHKEITDETHHYTFAIDGKRFGSDSEKTTELIKVGIDDDGNPITVIEEGATLPTGVSPLAGAEFTLTGVGPNNANTFSMTATSDADGRLFFNNLEEGTYKLNETKAPAGYRKDTTEHTVVIDADYNDDGTLKSYKITIDGTDIATYSVTTENKEIKVINKGENKSFPINDPKGTELPSTGGIGTTIFYILGGLLVIGAAVVLVARRKAHD